MKNIAVIMGGRSEEHGISLETGANVVCALDLDQYKVFPVKIEQSGQWNILPEFTQSIPRAVYKKLLDNNHLEGKAVSVGEAITTLQNLEIEFVFIALHGQFGEDGSIQGLCEQAGFAYNGSGIFASSLAIDKLKSAKTYESAALDTPRQIELPKNFANNKKDLRELSERIERWFNYPCIVKPRFGGSSLGMSLVNNKEELKQAIKKAQDITDDILIQEFIKGREFSVGVLDIDKPLALPPTEIIKSSELFDFDGKYNDGALEVTPARIPPTQVTKLQEAALKAHESLGCQGYSRTDIIAKDNDTEDTYYILETNTLPGLTSKSIFPAEALAQGISFSALLDKLIDEGLKRITK